MTSTITMNTMDSSCDISVSTITRIKHWLKKKNTRRWLKRCLRIVVLLIYFITGIVFYKLYEGWDWTTSVFFTLVTICTIGYGKNTPTDDNSRLFTIFYMICGIYLIFHMIYHHITSHGIYKMKYLIKNQTNLQLQSKYRPKKRIFFTMIALGCCIFLGVIFFIMNEKWSFISALYFAIETSTTVGYGDLIIKYDSTRLFLCFYMIISSILIIYLVNNINIMKEQQRRLRKRKKMLQQKSTLDNIVNALDTNQGVNKHQFVLAILQHLQIVNAEEHILPWFEKFHELDTNQTGLLSHMQIQLFCHREMEQSRKEIVEMVDISQTALIEELLEVSSTRFRSNSTISLQQHTGDMEERLKEELINKYDNSVVNNRIHHQYAQLPDVDTEVADEERRQIVDRLIAEDSSDESDDSEDEDHRSAGANTSPSRRKTAPIYL